MTDILKALAEVAARVTAALSDFLETVRAAFQRAEERRRSLVRRRDARPAPIYLYYGPQCWDTDPYPYRRVPYRD